MQELSVSPVKSNLSLPQQPVLTLHLFLCWRAIKYSSRVSSTAEASFSPWHVLLSFKNTRVSKHTHAHDERSERPTSAVCGQQIVIIQLILAQVCTFTNIDFITCITTIMQATCSSAECGTKALVKDA